MQQGIKAAEMCDCGIGGSGAVLGASNVADNKAQFRAAAAESVLERVAIAVKRENIAAVLQQPANARLTNATCGAGHDDRMLRTRLQCSSAQARWMRWHASSSTGVEVA